MKKINNRLVSNIFSLIILQGSNYIFPLVTLPYLVRILGVDQYGVLIFCTTFTQFLNIFVDYGFNISGTREISINKNNSNKVNEIYNNIMSIKLIFTFVIGLIYFIIVNILFSFYDHKFHDHQWAFLIAYLIIIGNTLFPVWLYQGLEIMKYITYINVFTKVIITIMIFIFINDKDDINLAVLFQTLYFLVPGIISVFFVRYKFKIKFKFVLNLKVLINEIQKGKHIFLTNLWIKFYNQGPVIILGFILGNKASGNYGIGQKIQTAFTGIFQPVSQAYYPYLCELFSYNKKKFIIVIKKICYFFIMLSFITSLLLFFLSKQIVYIITGNYHKNIIILAKLFSFIIFFSIMNTIMSRIMYAMNLQKLLEKIYSKAAVIFVLLSIPLSLLFKEFGMTLVVTISEGIVFALNITYIGRIISKSRLSNLNYPVKY